MSHGHRFDVAINGAEYLVDYGQYRRRTVPAQREQRDMSTDVGEHTLSTAGQWVRSETDWSHGAGQTVYDAADSDRARFSSSKNIDVFTKGQISLCKAIETKSTGTNSNLYARTVNGTVFYFSDGQYLKYGSPDAASPTFSSSDQGAAITDWTSDGTSLYSATGSAVVKATVSSTTAGATIGAFAADIIEFANGRLLAADGTRLVELGSAGGISGSALDETLPGTCVAIKGGPQAIYVATNMAGQGVLCATTLSTADGSLSYPVTAGVLPVGETFSGPFSMDTFGEIIIVATSKGVRFGVINQNDTRSVTFGPVIDTGGAASGVRISGQYAYWGCANGDTYKADLTVFVDTLVPAYSRFLAFDSSSYGVVDSLEIVNNKLFFTDSSGELYGEDYTGDLSTDGELNVGTITYSTVANKLIRAVSGRFATEQSGAGTPTDYRATADYSSGLGFRGGISEVTGTATVTLTSPTNVETTMTLPATGETTYAPAGGDVSGEVFEAKIVLTRDTTTTTSGPILHRWSLDARPQPERIEEILAPLVLQGRVMTSSGAGAPVGYDTHDAYNALLSLVTSAKVVTYEEGERSSDVSVEDLELQPVRFSDDGNWWEGTCLVRLLTIP